MRVPASPLHRSAANVGGKRGNDSSDGSRRGSKGAGGLSEPEPSLYRRTVANAASKSAAEMSHDSDVDARSEYNRAGSVRANSENGEAGEAGPSADIDNASQASGSESEASRGGVTSSDFRRAKKFKRLQRLLTSARARRSVTMLENLSKIAAVVILLMHLGVFVAIRILLNNQITQINEVHQTGEIKAYLQAAVVNARELQALGAGSNFTLNTVTSSQTELLDNVDK